MVDLTNIPKSPGCYLFKDSKGKIIYVGKAKNLEKRVKSYFSKKDHGARIALLVSNINSVEFFITDNEVEALVLENNLIKKHSPKYNVNLKDSKRYAYIQITKEEYPQILIARKKEGEGEFYGPFVSGTSRDFVLELLRKTFRIRTCKRLPKRACLRYSIGICSAPCINKISKKDYLKDVERAREVLKGKTKDLIKELEIEMKDFSKKEEYEISLDLKKKIDSIKYLEERQNVERNKNYDEDIINYVVHEDFVYLSLFNSFKGILESKKDFEFEFYPDFLEDFLIQYYSENKIPKKIVVPDKIEISVNDYLSKKNGKKVELIKPLKGELKTLLDLVKKNIENNLFGDFEKIKDLMKSLNLNELPKVIECFDISHLSGTSTVASMVSFRNGKPDKNNYRRFKIRSVDYIDDFLSMKEVVKRRYTKLKNENLPMPNLIIIDGGKGQLSFAKDALEEVGVKIPIISLAKREEEIFVPGKVSPILLNKKSKAFNLVTGIRDEAHRFAIKYNRLLRGKKFFE